MIPINFILNFSFIMIWHFDLKAKVDLKKNDLFKKISQKRSEFISYNFLKKKNSKFILKYMWLKFLNKLYIILLNILKLLFFKLTCRMQCFKLVYYA